MQKARENLHWVALIIVVLAIIFGARFTIKMGLSGDEPHYLVMSNSLKNDKDFDIKNDYVDKVYKAYYPDNLEPHINWALINKDASNWHSIHGPGLPMLILPGVLFSKRLGPLIILAGFALIAVLASVYFSKTVSKTSFAFLAGLLLAISIPFLSLAGYIFPDLVAGSLVALIFAIYYSKLRKELVYPLIGLISAVLVWVHVKTTLIAVTVILYIAYRIIMERSEKRLRNIALLMSPFLLLILLLQVKFFQWYGVLTPNGIYKGNNQLFQISPFNVLLASLVDPFKGLLVTSPIWFAILYGFPEWYRKNKEQLIFVSLVVIPSALIQFTFNDWAGGWSSPGRYLMLYLPVILPALALGYEAMFKRRGLKILAIFLICVQIVISSLYVILKTPWGYAGSPSPFISLINEKLNINIPTVYFDQAAIPNSWGLLLIILVAAISIMLILINKKR